jgi:hypothetical protein
MEANGARVKIAGRYASPDKGSVDYGHAITGKNLPYILSYNGRRALVLSAMPIQAGMLPPHTPIIRWKGYGQENPVYTVWTREVIPITLVHEIVDLIKESFGAATVEQFLPQAIVYIAYLIPINTSEEESLSETPLKEWFQSPNSICGEAL